MPRTTAAPQQLLPLAHARALLAITKIASRRRRSVADGGACDVEFVARFRSVASSPWGRHSATRAASNNPRYTRRGSVPARRVEDKQWKSSPANQQCTPGLAGCGVPANDPTRSATVDQGDAPRPQENPRPVLS